MGLESSFDDLSDLNSSWPLATDKAIGSTTIWDANYRGIKDTVAKTFPNIASVAKGSPAGQWRVDASATELNYLVGVTSGIQDQLDTKVGRITRGVVQTINIPNGQFIKKSIWTYPNTFTTVNLPPTPLDNQHVILCQETFKSGTDGAIFVIRGDTDHIFEARNTTFGQQETQLILEPGEMIELIFFDDKGTGTWQWWRLASYDS